MRVLKISNVLYFIEQFLVSLVIPQRRDIDAGPAQSKPDGYTKKLVWVSIHSLLALVREFTH